jgi:hypothetical protein
MLDQLIAMNASGAGIFGEIGALKPLNQHLPFRP